MHLLEVPDKVRVHKRTPKSGAVDVRVPGDDDQANITPIPDLPAPHVVLTPEGVMNAALKHVGQMRNAFALRGITLVVDEKKFAIQREGAQTVLHMPASTSVEDVQELFHQHVTKVLLLLKAQQHPRSAKMWLQDDDFLKTAERLAHRDGDFVVLGEIAYIEEERNDGERDA